MTLATINDIPFRINPTSVSWAYRMKTSVTETIGGRVIQLFGVNLGDLTIQGSFGRGGPVEQEQFFNRMMDIMAAQTPRSPTSNPVPVRFVWADRRWDFSVYIKSFTQPGISTSVGVRNDILNPAYQLVFFIQEDNQNILQAVKDAAAATYINRLTAGMGWKQTSWNGPTGTAELQDALQGQTLLQALFNTTSGTSTLTTNDTSTLTPDQVFNDFKDPNASGTPSTGSGADNSGTGD